METILKATGITKIYGKFKALDNVSLAMQKGQIYGLIGENGAGKSTFMRTVMGMISINGGSVELFGSRDNLGMARRRMGQSIETPAVYPNLSARDNLRVQAACAGVKNPDIEGVLKQMNLSDTGNKKAKDFSLGMRQRLALAQCLITSPELLILDEPVNGLDPVGIIEMREVLQGLASKGVTILLSSHLLDELSQIATHFGILHKGRLVKEFTKSDLDALENNALLIKTSDNKKAMEILEKSGLEIHEIAIQAPKLEDFYMEAIK